MAEGLTTTSYAILGWLDVSSFTTYELAKMMRANLAFFWPRAASRLYEEPKNLVARGMATLEYSYVGKRRRTMYSITDAGRQALREWQSEASAAPNLEFESLVHLYFGANATKEQMVKAVDSVKRDTEAIFQQGLGIAETYLGGTHPFPDRAQFSFFIYDFLWSFGELLRDWSERASSELALWDDTAPSDDKRARAHALMRACLARYQPPEALPLPE